MKKRVILLRHAKTEPFGYGKKDFERNLVDKGINDAHMISLILQKKGFSPEYIISSTANRAKQTAKLFAERFGIEQIQYEQEIYDSIRIPRFLALLSEVPSNISTVLFVGHNPDIFELASQLSNDFIPQVPTCCALSFGVEVNNWDELCSDSFLLETIEKPKSYR